MTKKKVKKQINAALIQKVKAAVLKSQDASYKFVCSVIESKSIPLAKRVLKSLSRMNVVAQNEGRRWLVIMSPDGSVRERPKAPRRLKKISRKRPDRPAPKAAPVKTPQTGITTAAKLQKLQQLVEVATPESHTARVLTAVIADVESAEQARKVQDVLS